ncbi:NmrA family NAD(P)-binding protein [Actinoplanes sp. CA-252034]|uniref:NmrA family NAD(P)-binding protein n=1 Tax=Actinoplanes sp. CA-252034 TaxID=3239906 RepID=UPI003D994AB4
MSSVLVTGASGNVGRHIVDQLASTGVEVRAAGHSPAQSDGVRPLGEASGSADWVPFGFSEPATWEAAFAGVQTMFLLRPPAISNVKRDLLPAVAAARRAGLRHVVFLSLQGAQHNRVVPHAKVESWLRSSGLGWTFVRPSFFTQNLSTTHVADIRDRDQIIIPAGGGRTAFVDAMDVASVATAALLNPENHRGWAWTVTGPEALTYAEVADILTRVLGRSITYTRPGLLRYLRHARRALGMPRTMAVVTGTIYTTARMGFAAGLTDDVRRVTGRAPLGVEETAQRERAAWTASPA